MLRGRLLCKDYKVLGTQYLIDKNSKVSTPAAVGAKNFRVFTFSPIGPRSSTVFWTNTTYCAFVTNVQSVLPKDFFLLFLVMFMCNLAWQPVNKTFINHYHIGVGQQDYFWIFTSRHLYQSSILNPDSRYVSELCSSQPGVVRGPWRKFQEADETSLRPPFCQCTCPPVIVVRLTKVIMILMILVSCCDLLKCTVGLAVPLEAANSQTQLPTCGRLCISVIIVIAITIIIIINNH